MSRVYICNLIPNDQVTKFKNISQAAQIFNHKILNSGIFTKTNKIVPIFIKEKIPINNNYIQVRVFPHLSIGKYLNILFENLILIKNSLNVKHIWYYNLTLQFLFSFLILKVLNKKIYIIVADFNPPKSLFSTNTILYLLLKLSNGQIFLSDNINFKNHKFLNYQILNGLVEINNSKIILDNKHSNNNTALFSGALNKYTGIELALEVFKEMPNINLIITGRGALEDLVSQYADKYNNIKFYGFVSKEEYQYLLAKARFCLSFRNPTVHGNDWNFPSKIIEYLSHGKVVISTMQYNKKINEHLIISNYDKDDLIKTIQKLKISNHPNYSNINFVKNNYSINKFKELVNIIEKHSIR